MAKNQNNNATHGIRGKVGQLVYSLRNGQSVVSKVPSRTAPLSESQKAIISTFKMAAEYAKNILLIPEFKQAYQAKCKRGQSPYNLAVADFFKSPVIDEVDLSLFNASQGSKISAIITDNFQVKEVKVRIEKNNGTLIEEGNASKDIDGLHWIYNVTTSGANQSGYKVTISATDIPGHTTFITQTM